MAESRSETKKGKRKRGRPRIYSDENRPPRDKPRDGYTRATFIVREDLVDKIKALAYWERMEIKEVLEEAILNHIKGKKIKSIPGKKQKAYKGS